MSVSKKQKVFSGIN